VVRETKTLDDRIESTRGIIMSPEQLRAQRRSFAYGNTAIENPDVTRDIVARADADFERIFGSE
jgi:hypothetical protein